VCGICGFTGPPLPSTVSKMLNQLHHRGPDDEGLFESPVCTLGVRRLAIIDVAGGHQPVLNEDHRVSAVMNGEIYNYRDLRRTLERRGHRFRSETDTEVLPHLYEEYGSGLVSLLRGMFAFAIWDASRERLLLARDRAGEKPLLFAHTNSGVVFASELKALLAHPDVSQELNPRAVRLYLSLQYVPGPDTILRDVAKLPAGHILMVERGGVRVEQYWDAPISTQAHFRSWQGAAKQLRSLLEDAVGAQLHADVPVGALLSGGLDSAGIVGLIARARRDEAPRTFTVGFSEFGDDERAHARAVARALGTNHTELMVEPPTFSDLARFVWHLDEPIGDQAALPTYLIARVAREHVKVVLTGEGADELFGGYPRYRWLTLAARLEGLPRPIRSGLAKLAQLVGATVGRQREADLMLTPRSTVERQIAWVNVFTRPEIDRLLIPGFGEFGRNEAVAHMSRVLELHRGGPPAEQVMYLDLKTWLVDDILTKVDRMSMAASIEARAPYLDHHVVEFATSLPAEVRVRGPRTKALLRAALADILPANLLTPRKRAFQVPVQRWLAAKSLPAVHDALLSTDAMTRAFVRPDAIPPLLRRNDRDAAQQIWSLFILELWMRQLLGARQRSAGIESALD
jgi:asparagine synthase (glutamine-hydrolysing)